jgi:hypothetical protein
MMMTCKPTPVPDEEAFAAIKAGIDDAPSGAKVFLNSGRCDLCQSPFSFFFFLPNLSPHFHFHFFFFFVQASSTGRA